TPAIRQVYGARRRKPKGAGLKEEQQMGSSGYWAGFRERQLRRRTVLRGAAAAGGLGIVSLAGCAPSTSPAPTTPPLAALPPAAPPGRPRRPAGPAATVPRAAAAPAPTVQPPAAAKYGGIIRQQGGGEAPNMDPHLTGTSLLHTGPAAVYGRLLKYQAIGEPP